MFGVLFIVMIRFAQADINMVEASVVDVHFPDHYFEQPSVVSWDWLDGVGMYFYSSALNQMMYMDMPPPPDAPKPQGDGTAPNEVLLGPANVPMRNSGAGPRPRMPSHGSEPPQNPPPSNSGHHPPTHSNPIETPSQRPTPSSNPKRIWSRCFRHPIQYLRENYNHICHRLWTFVMHHLEWRGRMRMRLFMLPLVACAVSSESMINIGHHSVQIGGRELSFKGTWAATNQSPFFKSNLDEHQTLLFEARNLETGLHVSFGWKALSNDVVNNVNPSQILQHYFLQPIVHTEVTRLSDCSFDFRLVGSDEKVIQAIGFLESHPNQVGAVLIQFWNISDSPDLLMKQLCDWSIG